MALYEGPSDVFKSISFFSPSSFKRIVLVFDCGGSHIFPFLKVSMSYFLNLAEQTASVCMQSLLSFTLNPCSTSSSQQVASSLSTPEPPSQLQDAAPPTKTETWLAGGLFGAFLALVTQPANTLSTAYLEATTRTENPAQVRSLADSARLHGTIARDIFSSRGVIGFFHRLGPRAALCFSTFSLLNVGLDVVQNLLSAPRTPTVIGLAVVDNVAVRTPLLTRIQLPSGASMQDYMRRLGSMYRPVGFQAFLSGLRGGYFGIIEANRDLFNHFRAQGHAPPVLLNVAEGTTTFGAALVFLQAQERAAMERANNPNAPMHLTRLFHLSALQQAFAVQSRNGGYMAREFGYMAGVRYRAEGTQYIVDHFLRPAERALGQ